VKEKTGTLLAALAPGVAGCGETNAPDREDDEPPTAEEATLSSGEMNDEETAGEAPGREPALRDATVAR